MLKKLVMWSLRTDAYLRHNGYRFVEKLPGQDCLFGSVNLQQVGSGGA